MTRSGLMGIDDSSEEEEEKGNNTCNICMEENITHIYKPCINCDYSYCHDCLCKHNNTALRYKCAQCKVDLKKYKYFFAGKMDHYDPEIRRLCFLDEDCLRFYRKEHKGPRYKYVHIKYFRNTNELLLPISHNMYQITGPTVIIKSESAREILSGHAVCTHGCFRAYPGDIICPDHDGECCGGAYDIIDCACEDGKCTYKDSYRIKPNLHNNDTKIVLERCDENIEQCDVFSLEINEGYDCNSSMREFGIAECKGKILLIYFSNRSKNKILENNLLKTDLRKKKRNEVINNCRDENFKQFHMFICRVINSLEKLKDYERNWVIKCHPKIQCDNYSEYIEYLEDF